jgi:hypothetical protein
MKNDLAIAIRIGSSTSELEVVKNTIESIRNNIGECNYRFIISLDPRIKEEIKKYIKTQEKHFPDKFKLLPEENIFWAEFINKAIKLADGYEYFIKAHDDIVLLTPNFFPIVKKMLDNSKEKIAWISFDESGYLDGHWSPPTRPGFYKDFLQEDAWNKRKMFQFHNLPDNWWRRSFLREIPYLLQQKINGITSKIKISLIKYPEIKMIGENRKLLDFPKGPVKSHAPWNSFVLIKKSVLDEIGLCENWQTYNALLADEDWGLRALKLKYWNIWIPSIKYSHVRPREGGDRSQIQIKNDSREIDRIKIQHNDNYIPWSIGRYSYDWDYLKINN